MRVANIFLGMTLCVLPTQVSAEDLTGALKTIKETGTISIGYRESSVPFSYLDDKQQPVGFAMDICYKIVDAVKAELKLPKLDVKLVPVTSATRIPLIENGTIVLECGSTTNNAERQTKVSFTNTYFLSATKYVSKKSAAIKAFADLKGKTVVSTSGTTNLKQVQAANAAQNLGLTINEAKDHAESFLMVETGRAAAFAMDDILLASLVANSKSPSLYTISTDTLSKAEPYGIIVPKGDTAFKKVVDAATAALYKSPEGPALYDKWFTKPIPPKGINLNLPMSPELKKAFANPSDSPDPAAY